MSERNSNKNNIMHIVNILMIMLFLTVSLLAQTGKSAVLDNNEIDGLISKLQKKVLLSGEQVKSIQIILKDYSNQLNNLQSGKTDSKFSSKQQLINETIKKINTQLDEKQKMKFEIIKDDWWSEVISEEND